MNSTTSSTARILPLTLCWLLATQPFFPQARQPYQFTWVEGGPGTVNQSRSKRPVDMVLQVSDLEGNPVRGADVTFFFPTTGATLTPPGGGTTVTARTDDNGRVRVVGLIPFGSGGVTIRVSATLNGVTGSTTIQHSNVMPPVMTPAKWAIGGAGAAAVVTTLVYVFVVRESPPTRVTLGPGSVAPQR
jgi:hypothetical protein